jgi:hypothetical protein
MNSPVKQIHHYQEQDDYQDEQQQQQMGKFAHISNVTSPSKKIQPIPEEEPSNVSEANHNEEDSNTSGDR